MSNVKPRRRVKTRPATPVRYLYPVSIRPDGHGRFLAAFPDLPEAVTDGATEAEALAEASDCLEEAIAGRLDRKDDIPAPSSARGRPTVALGPVLAAKVALHDAMRATGTSNVKMAKALGLRETEVRRMLDPHHATKIGRLDEALNNLGRRLVVTIDAG